MNVLDYYYSCGNGMIARMNGTIPHLTSLIVDLLKIGIPVLLIVLGMLDFGKAVMSQKEDEIKKNQTLFVKRLISAALVFFVFIIVELVFNLVAGTGDEEKNIWACVSCFMEGEDSSSCIKLPN